MGLRSWWRERGAEVERRRNQVLYEAIVEMVAGREAGRPDPEGSFVDHITLLYPHEYSPQELYAALVTAGTEPWKAHAIVSTRC